MPATMPASSVDKVLALRRPDFCRTCSSPLPVGTRASYRRSDKTVACLTCVVAAAPEAPSGPGTPGASAKREYERRRQGRERRTREAHPHIGGLLLALSDGSQSERAWAQGSAGEERVAAALGKRCRDTPVRFLHDRRVPGTRANIDHLAIAPSGVYVIDAKDYAGGVDVEITGGILRPRVETLRVGRRDRTKLVAGVERQIEVTVAALADMPKPPQVHGVLCFVDSEMPLIRQLAVREVAVLGPRRLAKRLKAPGPLEPATIEALVRTLAAALPPAA